MQRHSKKRDAVYAALSKTKIHPSAEMLYDMVKPELPEISLSTVYRNLMSFCANGSVKVVATVSGETRFDADMSDHDHFICRRCSKVYDIDNLQNREELIGNIANVLNAEADSFTLYGLCRDCLDR